jgi:hypothetical protein
MGIIQTGQFTPLGIPIIIIQYTDGGTETLPDGDWAIAAWKAGTITLNQFADEVIRAIDNDIRDGVMPADVATFSELHLHVDANVYLLDVAGMATPGENDDGLELPNAISNEVDRRLRARTGTDDMAPKPNYVYAVVHDNGHVISEYTRSKARAHAAWIAATPCARARSSVGRFEVTQAPEDGDGR